MMKLMLLAGSLLGMAAVFPKNEEPAFPNISSAMPLKWKTSIGLACFRTNVIFLGDRLYIGSNGESFMDHSTIEPKSGVYVLDRRSGKIIRQFGDEPFGDMDVNGLLLFENRIYFGNDNEEFLCADKEGRLLWQNPASGDIEHEPVLLRANNRAFIIYATEAGEVKAVNPSDGSVVWSYYTPEFSGWKPGDNRTVFKIGTWFATNRGFFTRPLVVDLNSDGAEDLLYRNFYGKLIAINGINGRVLWETKEDAAVDMGFSLIGKGKDREILVMKDEWVNDDHYQKELIFYGFNGKILRTVRTDNPGGGGGLNIMKLPDGRIVINGRTKTLLVGSDGAIQTIDRAVPYNYLSWDNREISAFRNSSDALIGNRTIPLPNGKTGLVVLNQYDEANRSNAFIEILSIEDKRVVDRFSLPESSEMPPVIEDVDGDGNLDILFGTYDGNLYCYQLPKIEK